MTPPVFRSPEADAAFGHDGMYVAPLLDAHEIARLRAVFDRYPEQHEMAFSATILSHDLGYRRAVHEALCEVFLPHLHHVLTGYRIFTAGFLAKQPGPDGALPMHQDLTLVRTAARPALSIWCPLVDVTPRNAAVEVARGTHGLNRRPRAAGTPFAYPELEAELRANHLEAQPMKAGAALFLHHGLIHASPPNLSGTVRPVAAAVLAPDEAPLVYYHRRECDPPLLEEYAVDEDFYQRHLLGTRPPGEPRALLPEGSDPCPARETLAALGCARATR